MPSGAPLDQDPGVGDELARMSRQGYSFSNRQSQKAEKEDFLDEFDSQLLYEGAPPRQDLRCSPVVTTTRSRLSLPARYGGSLFGNAGSQLGQAQAYRTPDSRLNLSGFVYTPPGNSDDVSSSPQGMASSPTPQYPPRRVSQGPRRARPLLTESNNTPPRFGQQVASARGHSLPMVQGIQLVSVHELPDRFRSIFQYPVFNAIQSKCFDTVYRTNDNIVLASPTGSGKTAVLELAICRLMAGYASNSFKIVYQAPIKSLCSERQRDWSRKFGPFDLVCAELTGDTDQADLRHVQGASIIITTPEKWDSMTRKWRDHRKLMELVKLFLIDEVHTLQDRRGATLEAVVSRMKSIGSDVRFLALSATVPNSQDIATWLGKDSTNQHLPARRERFSEEFRPVKLQRFVYGFVSSGNDFSFDKILDTKLAEIITKHSHKKPIMIFCLTRNITVSTAKNLAHSWRSSSKDRCWHAPTQNFSLRDTDLKGAGVAYHHAGLDITDRQAVEKSYLEGQISVICCTSTLAVGVNLPCHLVIIKNTVTWTAAGPKEYADLDIMQMLGRAGRPQFDDSAVAVIMTRRERVDHYRKMVSVDETVESCLHLHLIEHLNAEIGLGTISDTYSARKWLEGSFLYVRLKQNPNYYKLEDGSSERDLDEAIGDLCDRNISRLVKESLISLEGLKYKCTEFGDAMSRYYLKFETMRTLLALKEKAGQFDILTTLSLAEEFKEVRLKPGEKSLYKEINKANGIKFPIKVDIALAAHKASLILQSELGGVEFPGDNQFRKYGYQFAQDKAIVLQHVHRLVCCIIDCKLHQHDSTSVRNGLELARSLNGRAWDNSPLQLKQIASLGPAAVRKLAAAGVKSIGMLEATEPHRIEMILSRNPTFGNRILEAVKEFPKLTVSATMTGKDVKYGEPVRARFKAVLGYNNNKAPIMFNRKLVSITFLAETSDGELLDFRRTSMRKFRNGQVVMFMANLARPEQYVICYAMCDEIAGTLKYVEVKPNLDPSLFPAPATTKPPTPPGLDPEMLELPQRHDENPRFRTAREVYQGDEDEFGDGDINDSDLVIAAGDLEFEHIDREIGSDEDSYTPRKLENGKWACNHRCKDKTKCKHMCCRDGLDKPGKQPRKKIELTSNERDVSIVKMASITAPRPRLTVTAEGSTGRRGAIHPTEVETVDLTCGIEKGDYRRVERVEYKKLDAIHSKSQKTVPVSAFPKRRPKFSYADGIEPDLSFMGIRAPKAPMGLNLEYTSDEDALYGSPPRSQRNGKMHTPSAPSLPAASPLFSDSITSSMEAVMARLDDPHELDRPKAKDKETMGIRESFDFGLSDMSAIIGISSPVTVSSVEEKLPEPPRNLPAGRLRGNPLFVTDSPIPSSEEVGRKRKRDHLDTACTEGHDPIAYSGIALGDEEGKDQKRRLIAKRTLESPSSPMANRDETPQPNGDQAAEKDKGPFVDSLDGIDPEVLAFLGDCVEFID
ncbi:MAG: Sec63 [Geoglossum simile]|nr:MAG: Sec63 [Geoglossum simile]